jgi:RND family efflux transporter MFP subunit
VPQRLLPDLRQALDAQGGEVIVNQQGLAKSVTGRLAVIDNSVDTASGTVTVRAMFENADSVLWPGALCNVRLTLRVMDDVVTVPAEAVRAGQKGSYVYTVDQNVAHFKVVKPGRTVDGRTEIVDGLDGSETVVTDGQLLLTDGAKVELKGQAATGAVQ